MNSSVYCGRSTEWVNVPEEVLQQLGVVCEEDGEFWFVTVNLFFSCVSLHFHSRSSVAEWSRLLNATVPAGLRG